MQSTVLFCRLRRLLWDFARSLGIGATISELLLDGPDQPPFIGCGTDGCIKYLQCATQACGYVLCTAVGGQSQSLIRRLSGSVLAIWGRLWNYAIGALGRPSQSSAAESSRQSVVCRPLVSG